MLQHVLILQNSCGLMWTISVDICHVSLFFCGAFESGACSLINWISDTVHQFVELGKMPGSERCCNKYNI